MRATLLASRALAWRVFRRAGTATSRHCVRRTGRQRAGVGTARVGSGVIREKLTQGRNPRKLQDTCWRRSRPDLAIDLCSARGLGGAEEDAGSNACAGTWRRAQADSLPRRRSRGSPVPRGKARQPPRTSRRAPSGFPGSARPRVLPVAAALEESPEPWPEPSERRAGRPSRETEEVPMPLGPSGRLPVCLLSPCAMQARLVAGDVRSCWFSRLTVCAPPLGCLCLT